MILKFLDDKEEIKKIICDPEIYERISDNNSPPANEFDFDLSHGLFIGGYVDNKIIAVSVFTLIDGWRFHPQILKPYRFQYAKEFVKRSLNWFWNEVNADKLAVKIPKKYMGVINFSKKFGFKPISERKEYMFLELRRP